jgi:MYXO-CTERM domain-containing protein
MLGFVASSLVGVGVLLAVAPEAQACSGCFDPADWAPNFEAVMPANVVGIVWIPHSSAPAGVLPLLFDADTNEELATQAVEVGGRVFVYPMEAAEAGRSYVFEIPDDACHSSPTTTIEATESVELPEVSLGILVASPPTLGGVPVPADVSCTEDVDGVRADIELKLSAELAPFADALLYETYVDGEQWGHTPQYYDDTRVGSSWWGRGRDRLVELCIDGVGGSPEPHTVQMKARVIGDADLLYASNTVEVILDCSMVPLEGETDDTAGTGEDTDSSSGGEGGFDGGGGEGGCACRVEGGSRAPALLLAMLTVLGLVSRRRPCG